MQSFRPAEEVTHVSDTLLPSELGNPSGPAESSKGTEDISSPSLSSEQQEIMDAVLKHENVFFTGNAGRHFLIATFNLALCDEQAPGAYPMP